MDDAIVALPTPSLTALMHRSLKRRKWSWEATCPELSISVSAEQRDEARDAMRAAVEEFLATAAPKEIEARLAKGTTYAVELLVLGTIVRADGEDEKRNWLRRMPSAAIAIAGATKDKAGDLATSVGGVAVNSGHFVADTAVNAYGAAGEIAGQVSARTRETVDERAVPLLIGMAEGAGNISEAVAKNSPLRHVAKVFNLDKWLDISSHVDTVKAARAVADLKAEFPAESNRQIARRLIAQKAIYAGGVGLSTSLPGLAIPMLALDMAATSLLQAELVLQIAAVYGLDLDDPARKGEMLAVFGCVVGGGKAGKMGLEVFRNSPLAAKSLSALSKVPVEKVGLGVLRNVPLIGAAIGATANVALIYALGNAACGFYEKRLDREATAEAMRFVKGESESYLAASMQQQSLADQVLLHVVLAGKPAVDKRDLLVALREMNWSETALETVERSFDSPVPLDELLARLDGEFAAYVSAQAHNVAHLDGDVNKKELQILEKINGYFSENDVAI